MENVKDLTPSVLGIEKIHLKAQNRHISVNPEKILFCKAEGSYTRVVIEGNCQEIIVSKPLKIFQRCIPEEMFLRCHYSYLINVKKVQSFDSKEKIIAFEGYHIPVSRRKSNHIFQILSDMGIQDVKNGDQI
jgi:two-component system LytT family response regulator